MFISMLLIMIIIMYFSKSPIMNILLLINMSLLIMVVIFNITNMIWLPSIIFLMMIGGLLILFMYMSSITPNKKSFNITSFKIIQFMIFMLMMIMFLLKKMIISPNPSIMIFSMINNLPFMIFSISYLFIFLFMLTLILKKKEGPLRSN